VSETDESTTFFNVMGSTVQSTVAARSIRKESGLLAAASACLGASPPTPGRL
jgi:hypothetical protein